VETATNIHVLLIEDDPGDARLVGEVLKFAENGHFTLETVNTLADGVKKLSERGFDVVLLDLSLPDSFGVTTVDQVLKQAPDQTIIVLTGAKDDQLALEASQKGAQDYLVKSEMPGGVLIRSIVYAIERKQAELNLSRAFEALKDANQRILEQQKSVIEEERLKVLLQMAGATSHELNQPLMALLGSIEIMRLDEDIPERFSQHLGRIDEAGRHIAEIVKKMSAIRQVETKPYPGGEAIINLGQKIRILYVEDAYEDYAQFQKHMACLDNTELDRANSMAQAISILTKEKFDLIFVDYMLPGGSGLDFLQWMEKEAQDTPVIAVTGYGDEVIATNMIKAGAYDYLPKSNVDQNTLSRCIYKALEKFKLKKEIERSNAQIVQMATHDPLTGLYNRNSMNDQLEKEFSRARRYGTDLACLLMDLDFFKEVNDTYGHHFGDHVLQQFGQRLIENLRETDLCFRYGGEEFMVLLPNTRINDALRVAGKIRHACESEVYDDGEHATAATVSIGVATVSDVNPATARDLLALADKALYRAKAEGRNRVVVYRQDLWKADTDKNFRYLKERLTAILDKTKKASVESLELMVWDRDGDRFKAHNRQVIQCFDLIGGKLGFSPSIVKSLQHAAIFHDATKVLLGDMDKARGLDKDEMTLIMDHPYKLHELIEPFDFFAAERSVLLWHHEHFDGNGYPDGLKGDEIPLGARIFAIVDAFVAMTSRRSYNRQFTAEEAVQELATCAGTQFDPVLVGVFIDALKENDANALSDDIVAAAKATINKAKNESQPMRAGLRSKASKPDIFPLPATGNSTEASNPCKPIK
jgi:two-component system cell cycle response regulator